MTMIFAMAGLSSRFSNAGYKKPKYMLDLGGNSVFYHAVSGFCKYFEKWDFIFVYRDVLQSGEFIKQECEKLKLKNYKLIRLDFLTQGQAHTSFLAMQNLSDDENVLIFNIDTFRPNFTLPNFDFDKIDGYLEVFESEGEQWSFVKPNFNNNLNQVAQTAEKERIYHLASSGLYYFKKVSDFKRVFETMQKRGEFSKNELYIAPMYNYLIKENKDIRYHKISTNELIFCGLPSEYEELKAKVQN